MNLELINREVRDREFAANRLEYSILFLQSQSDNYKHQEALWLLGQELFYMKDQLFNYRVLVNLLKDEDNGSLPKKD